MVPSLDDPSDTRTTSTPSSSLTLATQTHGCVPIEEFDGDLIDDPNSLSLAAKKARFGTSYRIPPSIASTTNSYAQSDTSTAIVNPQIKPAAPRTRSLQVDTSVAPSSYIWDEYYAENGLAGPLLTGGSWKGDEGKLQQGDGALSDSVTNATRVKKCEHVAHGPADVSADDIALAELLAMFAVPNSGDATDYDDKGLQPHVDYPGAEFLNLPDSASTSDFPLDFDLSAFDFSNPLDFQTAVHETWSGDVSNPDLDPTLMTAVISPLEQGEYTGFASSPLSGFDAIEPANHLMTHDTNQEDQLLHHDMTLPTPALSPPHALASGDNPLRTACINANSASQYEDAEVAFQESPAVYQRVAANAKTPVTKAVPESQRLCTMEMRALASDSAVLGFQKEVLQVVARFYTGLAEVFEVTSGETIELGMSRAGLMTKDDTISDLLSDIRSICEKLTAKADLLSASVGEVAGNSASILGAREARSGTNKEPIDLTVLTPPTSIVTPPKAADKGPDRSSRKRKDANSTAPSTERVPGDQAFPTPITSDASPSESSDSQAKGSVSQGMTLPSLPPLQAGSPTRIVHGPWLSSEIERLRALVTHSSEIEDGAPVDHVNWTWVVDQFEGTRNRHQVLIKAVELGLRATSTHYSRRVKQRAHREAVEPMRRDPSRSSIAASARPPPLLPPAELRPHHGPPPSWSDHCARSGRQEHGMWEDREAVSKRVRLDPRALDLSSCCHQPAIRYDDRLTSDPPYDPHRTPSTPSTTRNLSTPTDHRGDDRISPRQRHQDENLPPTPRDTPGRYLPPPVTPRSSLSNLGFKPYARVRPAKLHTPTHGSISSSMGVQPGPPLDRYDSSPFFMPGARNDGGRPSVISPLFGSFKIAVSSVRSDAGSPTRAKTQE